MAHLLQQGTSREAEVTGQRVGRLPYSRSSFEAVGHEVGRRYCERQAQIEDLLSTNFTLPEEASSVSVSLDRVSLPMEEPPKPPLARPDVYVPPPLNLPFRFEFTTTSVSDLITALEKALTEERRKSMRVPILPVSIPDFLEVEAYLLEVEERAEDLFQRQVSVQEPGYAPRRHGPIARRKAPSCSSGSDRVSAIWTGMRRLLSSRICVAGCRRATRC